MSGSRRSRSQRSAEPERSRILDRLEELEEEMEGGAWNPPRSSIILSICYSGGMVAGAVYDQAKTTVHLVRDIAEEAHFPVLSSILEKVNPTRILTNCAQDVNMMNFLSKACGMTLAEDDEVTTNTADDTLNATKREEEETANDGAFLPPRSCSIANDGLQRPLQCKPEDKDEEEAENRMEDDSRPEHVQQWVNEQPSKFSRSERSCTSSQSRLVISKDNEEEEQSDEEDEEDVKCAPVIVAELQKLNNCTYNRERALVRIEELFVSEALSECEAGLITRFRIDTGAVNMVRALGALLHHLDSARVGVEFLLPSARTPVSAIKTMIVQQSVEMDGMTFRALGVFAAEPGADTTVRNIEHAKFINKDRFSLFGLCCRCRSAPGKRMLRKWFERPTRDATTLQNRLDAVGFLADDENKDIVVYLHRVLKPVRSLKTTMKRLRASTMKINDWIGVHSTVHHLRELGQLLHSGRFRMKIMNEFKPFFDDRLGEVKTVMEAMIDYDESRVENRMVIRPGLDPDLDELKATYRSLPDLMTQAAQTEASRLGSPPSCAVGYVPLMGYLLQLPGDFDCEPYDLEVLYEDGTYLHVKSALMYRMDEEIGDLKMAIIDRETSIMLRLEKLVISRSRMIMTCVRAAAVIDCCLSLAATANIFGWCRPTIVEEAVIKAEGIFHPLAQLTVATHFVANPIDSGGDSTKVKIFTGPNACGKSVYLKQIGLLCYLAHVGSFVPAATAKIGLLSGILTRMYTLDGVLDGMSTFAKDVGQLSFALRRATGNSLVIIDEFGKGTMTEVGLSLLTASVEHLISKGDSCPHLLVATHFHALIDLLDVDQSAITYNTLEVLRQGAQLHFQFKLVEGIVNSSFAAFTAAKGGIPKRAVERSNLIYEHLRDGGRLCDIRLGIEGEEEMNEWLHTQMESAAAWMEGWNLEEEKEEGDDEMKEEEEEDQDEPMRKKLTTEEEEAVVEELVEMLRKHLFTEDELGIGEPAETEQEKEAEEPAESQEVEPTEYEQPLETDEADPSAASEAPPPIEEKEADETQEGEDGAKMDMVDRSKDTIASLIDEEPSKEVEEERSQQRVYTFPWEHEDEEGQTQDGAAEGSAVEGDFAAHEVTFPWELEDSQEEENAKEEEEGKKRQEEKGLEERLEEKGLEDEDVTLNTSHAVLQPLEETIATDNENSSSKTSDILNSTTTSILKGSLRKGDRTNDRSNLSVSFSKEVTMLEKSREKATPQVSPAKRPANFELFERLLRYSVEKGPKTQNTRTSTSELTIAVKRLRSH